jgi:excisionase family DNA binding protein
VTSDKNELISIREAARQCGRNMETIRRWVWSGKVPAEKLGNQLFIKKSDLTAYCRETAVPEYQVELKPDFLERAIVLQNKIKARGYEPIDAAESVRRVRDERMNQIDQSLH